MLAEVEKLTNDCAVCEKKLSQPEPLSTDPRTLKLQLAQQRVCCLCFRLLIFSDQFYVCSLAVHWLMRAAVLSSIGFAFIFCRELAFTVCLQCFDAVGWAAGRASGL